MKIFGKHIIIIFGLLISFYQSAHIFTHACIDQDENKKELIDYTDHKCNLCSSFVFYTNPENEFEVLQFVETNENNQFNFFNELIYNSFPTLYFQLRAPPFLI